MTDEHVNGGTHVNRGPVSDTVA